MAATPEQIQQTADKATKFLLNGQTNGNWETAAAPAPNDVTDVNGAQFTGPTALAVYALLCNGVSPSEPQIKSGIDFLLKSSTTGTYALACRCLVWSSIKLDANSRPIAQRDLKQLIMCMKSGHAARGLFFYVAPAVPNDPNDTLYDHSASQIAMLGVANAQRAGFEVPSKFWSLADTAWRSQQQPDGGWPYVNGSTKGDDGKERVSMTAAGVATLFLTQQAMQRPVVDCRAIPPDSNINLGIDWIAKNGKSVLDVYNPVGGPNFSYTLFTLSRIGAETGLQRFGDFEWYKSGADMLVKLQSPEGTWGGWLGPPQAQASLGLLFLAYGSAPVVMNKLDNSTGGVFSTRPHDAFNFSQWMGRETEQRMNWQLVPLAKSSVDDLHNAPVLYISGSRPLKFSPDELAKIKAFADEGGIIVGTAECGGQAFTDSFIRLGQTLYPDYQFRTLPKNHPIYTHEQYPGAKFKNAPVVRALSNGVRELMILPGGDSSRWFEIDDYQGREAYFQLFDNIVNYATDKKGLTKKGITYVTRIDPTVIPVRELKVARLSYKGNWDPEPGGWRQLSAVMRNDDKLSLIVEPVPLGGGKLKDYKVAHLTGTTPVIFDAAQRKELADFIAGGGLLIIDAAGGSTDFTRSIEPEIAAFSDPADHAQITQLLPADCELYQMPDARIDQFGYRDFARESVGTLKSGMLRGMKHNGRYSVLYSTLDISAGLVGESMDGIIGYSPKTATRLMRNILLYAAPPLKGPATTQATKK